MNIIYTGQKIVTKTQVKVDGITYHRHEVKRPLNGGIGFNVKWYSLSYIEITSQALHDKLEFEYQELQFQKIKAANNHLLASVFSWLSRKDYLTDSPEVILQEFVEDKVHGDTSINS